MNMHNVIHTVMRHVEHALRSSNKRGLLPLLYCVICQVKSTSQEVSDVDYGDIIDKLKTHFKPEPFIIYERYMFGKRSRKTDERIADFAVDLKRLSASCKFGNFLDEASCMQFAVGLSMSKLQSRLMQESTLAFDTTVKIAIAEHAAITSCAEIEPSTSRDSADRVHHVAATKHANPAAKFFSPKSSDRVII